MNSFSNTECDFHYLWNQCLESKPTTLLNYLTLSKLLIYSSIKSAARWIKFRSLIRYTYKLQSLGHKHYQDLTEANTCFLLVWTAFQLTGEKISSPLYIGAHSHLPSNSHLSLDLKPLRVLWVL